MKRKLVFSAVQEAIASSSGVIFVCTVHCGAERGERCLYRKVRPKLDRAWRCLSSLDGCLPSVVIQNV